MITIENYKKTINIMYIEDDVLATTKLKKILEKRRAQMHLDVLR